MFYYLDYKKYKKVNFITNTISVDCLRPVKFSALLSFFNYHFLIIFKNTADALLRTIIKSSDCQAHFTAV